MTPSGTHFCFALAFCHSLFCDQDDHGTTNIKHQHQMLPFNDEVKSLLSLMNVW